jgi:cytoskeletal protein CcmA (bactofilin family)
MIAVLAPLALTASTAGLLALPLTPALRELISKRDATPLVTRKDDGKIDNFARTLRLRCQPFQSWVQQCAARGTSEAFDLPEGKIFVAGISGKWQGPQETNLLVLCASSVQLPGGFHSLDDFVAYDIVHTGKNNIFRALLSETDIYLGEGTKTLRWVHAQDNLFAEEHCNLFGRASAGHGITLAAGCTFERMHAPVIYSSAEAAAIDIRPESAPFSKLAQAGIGRRRHHGRTHLVADEQHYGDLVSSKSLHMDKGACIYGSVKANGQIELAHHAEVDGSVVSTKSIHIASGSFVKGPLIAEHEIVIDSGVQIGLPGTPTTVSAKHIRVASGSVLHGTVWARVEGRVGD